MGFTQDGQIGTSEPIELFDSEKSLVDKRGKVPLQTHAGKRKGLSRLQVPKNLGYCSKGRLPEKSIVE